MAMPAAKLWIALLLALFLVLLLPHDGHALTSFDPCTSSPACQAYIGYLLPDNLRLRDIASLFGIDSTAILGANDFDLTLSDLENVVVPHGKLLKIPQTCACVNGIRKGNSTIYTVKSGDTLSTIANSYYAGIVTYQQIADANGIQNVNLIYVDQQLIIPFPCACRNGTDLGLPVEFLTYEIQSGDSLDKVAKNYSTTTADLMSINGITNSSSVQAQDVIFVPLAVCKATFNGDAIDNGLTVAMGSYMITAGTCVRCSCGNGTLYCSPTPVSFSGSCSSMTCAMTNLTLGNYSTANSTSGCTVQSCVYNGYTKAGILTTLQMTVDPTCPAPPPPPSLYKPPSGLAASPLGSPATAGGSSPTPTTTTTPTVPGTASQIAPSSLSTPGNGSPGSSDASNLANWWPFTVGLSLCLPLLIRVGAW